MADRGDLFGSDAILQSDIMMMIYIFSQFLCPNLISSLSSPLDLHEDKIEYCCFCLHFIKPKVLKVEEMQEGRFGHEERCLSISQSVSQECRWGDTGGVRVGKVRVRVKNGLENL